MKKKQSSEYEKVKLNSHLLDYLKTEDEWDVSQILVNLEDTIIELEMRNNLSYKWGSRKRRSAINNEENKKEKEKKKKKEKEKAESNGGNSKLESVVTSPLTPLAFSPSESEEKFKKIFKKKSTKRVLEESIDELKQTRELLSTEVEKVRAYYNKLLTYNSDLKAKEDELMSYQKKKSKHLEIGRDSKLGMNIGQQEKPVPYYAPYESFRYPTAYQPPLQVNGNVPNQKGLFVPLFASSSGLGHFSNQTAPSPYKVPDLNESYTEQAF